jgi:NAD(P)-dependent dehydrogenase (short-subunit alcohol dehydrogenase family)
MADPVFVCGVSRGIGLELAALYSADGHPVYGIARSPRPEREMDGLVYRSMPAQSFSIASFPELAGCAFATIILNSAIFGPGTQFSFELSGPALAALFEANAVSHYRVLKELHPLIKGDGSAKVCFIISKGGLVRPRMRGKVAVGYSASKAAQIALALTLVHVLGEFNIAVYLINPGSVKTRIGGANARFAPRESAGRVREVLSRASQHPSGTIFDHDGSVIDI